MVALGLMAGCGGGAAVGPSAILPAGFAVVQSGGALQVARPAAPLTYSDGLPAKRAASAFCAAQGLQLNPAAYGHFVGQGWQFAGGCIG